MDNAHSQAHPLRRVIGTCAKMFMTEAQVCHAVRMVNGNKETADAQKHAMRAFEELVFQVPIRRIRRTNTSRLVFSFLTRVRLID